MWTSPVATHANAEPLGETLQPAIARPIVAPERPLQLDPEAVGPEGARQPAPQRLGRRASLGGRRPPARSNDPRERPLARAPGEADEPLGAPLERGRAAGRGGGARGPAAGASRRAPR